MQRKNMEQFRNFDFVLNGLKAGLAEMERYYV